MCLFYLENNFTMQSNIDFCHWHLHKLLSFLCSLMRSSIDGRQGMIWLCKRWKFKKNVRFLVGYKWKSCLNTICRECSELIDQDDQAIYQNNLDAFKIVLDRTKMFWNRLNKYVFIKQIISDWKTISNHFHIWPFATLFLSYHLLKNKISLPGIRFAKDERYKIIRLYGGSGYVEDQDPGRIRWLPRILKLNSLS